MIRHGMGTAKTRKEIREAYQKMIEGPADGIEESADEIEESADEIEKLAAGIKEATTRIEKLTQKSTHKKRKMSEAVEANVMDVGRPKRSVKRPVS
jgi:predicted  nucleic acid-binding Zn-ribbon protein